MSRFILSNNKFDQSLIDFLPSQELAQISDLIYTHTKKDRELNSNFIDSLSKIIEFSGLGIGSNNDNSNTTPDNDAVTSGVVFENSILLVGFLSPIFKNYDVSIYGQDFDEEGEKIAQEKKEIFDWHFEEVETDFLEKMNSVLMWTINAGAGYVRVYLDPLTGMPITKVIETQNIISNSSYFDIQNASIKTVIDEISYTDFKEFCDAGIFKKIDPLLGSSDLFTENEITTILNEINGYTPEKNSSIFNSKEEESGVTDTQFQTVKIASTYVKLKLKKDPFVKDDTYAPYKIVTLYNSSSPDLPILAFDRNWINGTNFIEKEQIICYGGFPSLKGAGYGLVHYGLKSAVAASNILNQIITGARQANSTGGLIDDSLRPSETTITIEQNKFLPVKTGGDGVASRIYEIKSPPPDPSLFQAKEMLEKQIYNLTAAGLQKLVDMPSNTRNPTILSVLEKVEKPIVMLSERIAKSFAVHLKAYNDLFYAAFDGNETFTIEVPKKKINALKKHFSPQFKIIPSSDSVVKTSSLRFFIADLILNNAKEFPNFHNIRDVLKFYYSTIGVSNAIQDTLLIPEQDESPRPENPLSENANLLNSKPVKAFSFQDHEAHIFVHSQLEHAEGITPEIWAAASAHIQEHYSYLYLTKMSEKLKIKLPENPDELSEEQQNKLAIKIAEAMQKHNSTSSSGQKGAGAPQTLTEVQVMAEEVKNQRVELENWLKVQSAELKLKQEKLTIEKERIALEKERLFLDTEQKKLEILTKQQQVDDKYRIDSEKNRILEEKNKREIGSPQEVDEAPMVGSDIEGEQIQPNLIEEPTISQLENLTGENING